MKLFDLFIISKRICQVTEYLSLKSYISAETKE